MNNPRISQAAAAPVAWQPFTFRGVAAFAGAGLRPLLAVSLLVAIAATAVCGRLIVKAIYPVVSAALVRLPSQARIDGGRLVWPTDTPVVLANNRYLALTVNPKGVGGTGQSADVQIEFGPAGWDVSSLFGFVHVPYPAGYVIALGRSQAEAWWSTWKPHIAVLAALAVLAGLPLLWTFLATVLLLPLRLYATLIGRRATLGGCWRLAVAALMPGAVLMTAAILFYGGQRLSLIGLLRANGVHLAIDLIFLLLAPWRLPEKERQPSTQKS